MDEIKELWAVLSALPGQVWLDALYLFVLLGVLKAVKVVPKGAAGYANALLAVFMNGGIEGINKLTEVIQTSGVAVLAAAYYLLWKNYIGPFVGDVFGKIKGAIPSKG